MVAKLKSSFLKNSFQLFCYKHLLSGQPPSPSSRPQPQPRQQASSSHRKHHQQQSSQQQQLVPSHYDDENGEIDGDNEENNNGEMARLSISSPNLNTANQASLVIIILILHLIFRKKTCRSY